MRQRLTRWVKMMIGISRFVAVLLCVCLLLAGCRKQSQDERRKGGEAATVSVVMAPARAMSVDRAVDVVGTLYGDEEAVISAKVAGRVIRTLVDIGDRVDAGAALAQIDPVDYDLARKQAETQLQQTLSKLGLTQMPSADFNPDSVPTVQQAKLQAANAEARFGRSEKLFKQDPPLISEQEYADTKTASDVARTGYNVALLAARSLLAEARSRQADLDLADRRLADTLVRAPESDQKRRYAVTAKLVSAGEYLKDGAPMFRIVADDPIRFRASVPERYLSDVTQGNKATVRVESLKDSFAGTVRRINPQVDRQSRAFEVEIELANSRGLLRSGSFARGAITIRTESDATFVPAEAITTFAGIRKVYTVENGKAVEHEVSVGERKDNLVEITAGLKGTPKVVVSGANKLANGTSVQIVEKAAATTRTAG